MAGSVGGLPGIHYSAIGGGGWGGGKVGGSRGAGSRGEGCDGDVGWRGRRAIDFPTSDPAGQTLDGPASRSTAVSFLY